MFWDFATSRVVRHTKQSILTYFEEGLIRPKTQESGSRMFRSSFIILVILVSVSGCSLLHPIRQPRVPSTENKATRTDSEGVTEGNDEQSAEIETETVNSGRSLSDAVFAGVFIPVYMTGCFFWWVAHGCPDP